MTTFNVFFENGNSFIDSNYDSYNSGTQEILSIMDDQEYEFRNKEHYENFVKELEACKTHYEVKDLMYEVGTDYVDELEIQNIWLDIMFPRANYEVVL
jgi:hypothetical protein